MSTVSTACARGRNTLLPIALALVLMTPPPLDAQQKPPDARASDAKATAVPEYKPPMRGAPGGRVGGGTRGTGREAFILSVLAPNHTGLTTSPQPVLYWFISSPSSLPVELTVVDPQKADPLVELQIKPPITQGVHRVRLADHGVRLEPGVSYQWYVAVVPDAGRRSKDILAGGSIERVAPPDGLAGRLAQASKADQPSVYAGASLWYDAMAALGDLIDEAPQDRALLERRSTLLRQVGLPAGIE
jgi:uncharacterized protein DUF928